MRVDGADDGAVPLVEHAARLALVVGAKLAQHRISDSKLHGSLWRRRRRMLLWHRLLRGRQQQLLGELELRLVALQRGLRHEASGHRAAPPAAALRSARPTAGQTCPAAMNARKGKI